MNAAAEAIMQEALAKIEANGRAWADMRDKVQADPCHMALVAYAKSLERPITRSGWEGHGQMIDLLTSSRYWRAKRAVALAAVREGQIRGLPGYSKAWLRRAAGFRVTEMMHRATERRPVTLEAATDAFCAMLSAPYAVDEVA